MKNNNGAVFAVSGRNIFAGTGYGGIFLSTDDGSSWTSVNNGVPKLDSTYYVSIKCFAVMSNSIFAGTLSDSGVLLSTNNGQSWTKTNVGISDPYAAALGVVGTNLFLGTGAQVYLSTNYGKLWSKAQTGLPQIVDVNSFLASGSDMFAATEEGIFLTTNDGANWSEVDSGLASKPALYLAMSGSNLLASTYDGLYNSTNNGKFWSKLNSDFHHDIGTIVVDGTNLYAGTFYGVYQSTNNGANWSSFNVGLTDTMVYSISKSGSYLFAGVLFSGVWRCTL